MDVERLEENKQKWADQVEEDENNSAVKPDDFDMFQVNKTGEQSFSSEGSLEQHEERIHILSEVEKTSLGAKASKVASPRIKRTDDNTIKNSTMKPAARSVANTYRSSGVHVKFNKPPPKGL